MSEAGEELATTPQETEDIKDAPKPRSFNELTANTEESELSHPSIFDPDEEDQIRDLWQRGWFFTITVLASGLWMKLMFRLPMILQRTSGAALLIAFTGLLILLCIPLACLETFTGQYGGKSFLLVMNEVYPIFRGVGYAIVVDNLLEMVVYSIHVSHLFVYLLYSMTRSPAPWETCGAAYNTPDCTTVQLEKHCANSDKGKWFFNNDCQPTRPECGFYTPRSNSSQCLNRPVAQEQYYAGPIRNDPAKFDARRGAATTTPKLDAKRGATTTAATIPKLGTRQSNITTTTSKVDTRRSNTTSTPKLGVGRSANTNTTTPTNSTQKKPKTKQKEKPSGLEKTKQRRETGGLEGPSSTLVGAVIFVWIISIIFSIGLLKYQPYFAIVGFVIPLVIYIVFLFIPMAMDGAGEAIGLLLPFSEQSSKNLSLRCWTDAAALAFSCMSVGYGTYPTLAARSRARRRSPGDVLLVAAVCLTLLVLTVLGFYSLLGAHAASRGEMKLLQGNGDRPDKGSYTSDHNFDMARVLMPAVLGGFGGSRALQIVFFLTAAVFAFGSMALHVAIIISNFASVSDCRPHAVIAFTFVFLAGVGFGTFFTLGGAVHLLDATDALLLGSKKIILSLIFLIVVIFIYGPKRLPHYIGSRLKVRVMPPAIVWQLCWCILCPIGLLTLPILALLDKKAALFQSDVPLWTKIMIVFYEFYYWIIIVVFLVQTWLTWRCPRDPRGVWWLRDCAESEHSPAPSEPAVKEDVQEEYSKVDELEEKPPEVGAGDQANDPTRPLENLEGEDRREDRISRIRGLEKDPNPEQRDFFLRLHNWSKGPPKPPPPDPPTEDPEMTPAEEPADALGQAEGVDASGADPSEQPAPPPTPPPLPPTPPPLPPTPPPEAPSPPRSPSVHSIGSDYQNFLDRQSPTMLARALPIPEQERFEAEGGSRLPWMGAFRGVSREFGPDLMGRMSSTARRGMYPDRGPTENEPSGGPEGEVSIPQVRTDDAGTRQPSRNSVGPASIGSHSSMKTALQHLDSRTSMKTALEHPHTGSRGSLKNPLESGSGSQSSIRSTPKQELGSRSSLSRTSGNEGGSRSSLRSLPKQETGSPSSPGNSAAGETESHSSRRSLLEQGSPSSVRGMPERETGSGSSVRSTPKQEPGSRSSLRSVHTQESDNRPGSRHSLPGSVGSKDKPPSRTGSKNAVGPEPENENSDAKNTPSLVQMLRDSTSSIR